MHISYLYLNSLDTYAAANFVSILSGKKNLLSCDSGAILSTRPSFSSVHPLHPSTGSHESAMLNSFPQANDQQHPSPNNFIIATHPKDGWRIKNIAGKEYDGIIDLLRRVNYICSPMPSSLSLLPMYAVSWDNSYTLSQDDDDNG
jgi:hypothetical protein